MITSIARRRTFAELRRDGLRARNGSVRMNFLPLPVETPQVAFAIGRSFGNAVERNRGRRRLRAAFIEAAFPPAPSDSTKSTSSVDNPDFCGRSLAYEGRVERLNDLNGAFLLSGNRGLLNAPFTDLVEDVNRCLHKLKTKTAPQAPSEKP